MVMSFERSPDTGAVMTVLTGVNDEITYQDLARRSGLGLRRVKEVLASARRGLLSKDILFGTIRRVGLKRMAPTDTVKASEAGKKKAGRLFKREIRKLDTVKDTQGLSNVEQIQLSTNRTAFHYAQQAMLAKPPAPPRPTVNAPEMPQAANLVRLKK